MGKVTVITPGRFVRVEPDKVDADDILEFAAALIARYGWVKGDSGDEHRGFSIHGAIGEAAKRATLSHHKGETASRKLREAAKAQMEKSYSGRGGLTEFEINDTCTASHEAVSRILSARGVTV